ncbi:hypothetical protein [Devosia sp.]|nr:hypothetical protein [Devosia sp.]
MPLSTLPVLVAVLALFAVFMLALAYAQVRTAGMVAPGARPLD